MQTINGSSIDALKKTAGTAHQDFSDAHARLEVAEVELGKAAGIRSRLVRDLDGARKALSDARRLAIEAAISGAEFSEASTRVAALQVELDLLGHALRFYHAYAFADAQRAALAAKVAMLARQHTAEQLLLELRTAEIQFSLAPIAARNGGLEIQLGGAIRGHQELIVSLLRAGDEARESLKNYDAETRALRSEVDEL